MSIRVKRSMTSPVSVNVGEEVRQELPSVLGALSDNVDTLRREYCEGQHVGDSARDLGR